MAAKINWLWLRRSVMPRCWGGMLMLFQLLISALWRRTLILAFPPFICFIPKNSFLFYFINFWGWSTVFFCLLWRLYKCEKAFQCIKNLLIEKSIWRSVVKLHGMHWKQCDKAECNSVEVDESAVSHRGHLFCWLANQSLFSAYK